MKKILFCLIMFCIFATNGWGQIKEIAGNPEVLTGDLWMYTIHFSSALTQDTRFIIRTGKYGTFNNSQDTARVELIKKGKLKHEFFVKWGDIATNDAKIIAYKEGDLPSNVKTLKVKIIQGNPKPEEPQPNLENQIEGARTLFVGDVVEYYYKPVLCGAGAEYFIKWDYDPNIFEIVNYIKGNCANAIGIKLRAKEIGKETVSTIIHTTAKEKFQGNMYDGLEGKAIITVKYRPMSLSLESDRNLVCEKVDSIFKIQVKGLAPFVTGATIVWESGYYTELVAGQGALEASFRVKRGNGGEIIKATITYDGQEYILNHNKIWIGVPDRGTNIIDTKPNDYFSSIKIGYHDDYVESHEWLNLPSLYTSQRRNATMYIASKHIINAGGLNLAVDRTNKCGTTRFYWNLTVNGKSGEPPREKSIIKTDIENISSPVSIRVFSFTTGLVLYQQKNVIDFNIQNTSLKEGIYIVETTDAAGKVTTEKVQKNRQ